MLLSPELKSKEDEIEIIDANIYNSIKSVCKIESPNIKGTGFLIKLYLNNKDFFCLMTNEHVVTKGLIDKKEKITIFYDGGQNSKDIILDKKERFIKEYTNIYLDITIIQIIKIDNIDKKYFLLPYLDDLEEQNLKNKIIYIVQFPSGNLGKSEGHILNINKYEITHNAGTQSGSSGSPILLKDTNQVIGIHKGKNKNEPKKCGDLIFPIIQDLESINLDISEIDSLQSLNSCQKKLNKNKKIWLGILIPFIFIIIILMILLKDSKGDKIYDTYFFRNDGAGNKLLNYKIKKKGIYKVCVYGATPLSGGKGCSQCAFHPFRKDDIIEIYLEGRTAGGEGGKNCGYNDKDAYNGAGLGKVKLKNNNDFEIIAGGGGGSSESGNSGGDCEDDGAPNVGGGKGAYNSYYGKQGGSGAEDGKLHYGGKGGSSGVWWNYCGGGGGNGFYGGGGGGYGKEGVCGGGGGGSVFCKAKNNKCLKTSTNIIESYSGYIISLMEEDI